MYGEFFPGGGGGGGCGLLPENSCFLARKVLFVPGGMAIKKILGFLQPPPPPSRTLMVVTLFSQAHMHDTYTHNMKDSSTRLQTLTTSLSNAHVHVGPNFQTLTTTKNKTF